MRKLVFTTPFCSSLPCTQDRQRVNQGPVWISVPDICHLFLPLFLFVGRHFFYSLWIHLPSSFGFLFGSIFLSIALGLFWQSFGWFLRCWAKLRWSLLSCSLTCGRQSQSASGKDRYSTCSVRIREWEKHRPRKWGSLVLYLDRAWSKLSQLAIILCKGDHSKQSKLNMPFCFNKTGLF